MTDRWLEISVPVASDEVDDLQATLARWVGTNQCIEQPGAPEGERPAAATLRGYVPDGPECRVTRFEIHRALWHLAAQGNPAWRDPSERWLDAATYLNAWRDHYAPQPLGAAYLIVPSWLDAPAGPRRILRMDPGMAFGTGSHPTTQLAAARLERAVAPGMHVIDVGTGSGVLALLAAGAGAGAVTALDTDRDATRTAAANVARNGQTPTIRVVRGSLDAIAPTRAGVIVANIVAGVHCELMSAYARALAPGGILILGGIITERENEVHAAAAEAEFSVLDRQARDPWVCCTLASAAAPAAASRRAAPVAADAG